MTLDNIVNESQGLSTIPALKTGIEDIDKHRTAYRDWIVDFTHLDSIALLINPKVDILWLDRPFDVDDGRASDMYTLTWTLREAPLYNDNLMATQRLDIEFADPQFREACQYCGTLARYRRAYLDWLASQRGTPLKTGRTCLLCAAFQKRELSNLSSAQEEEAKMWLKMAHIRRVVSSIEPDPHRFPGLLQIPRYVQMHSNMLPEEIMTHGPFDKQGSFRSLPMLQKVARVMERVEEDLTIMNAPPDVDGEPNHLPACFDHFDGDALALYNNGLVGWYPKDMYIPSRYGEKTGVPICRPGASDGHERVHCKEREWCNNTQATACFWPLMTPNLHTLYIIDRDIKLRPGASIPPGSQTFHGNGCVYVEVPFPADPALEKGGEDDVWQYPAPRLWDADVFAFARQVRVLMTQHQLFLRSRGASLSYSQTDMRLSELTMPGVDSPQSRVIHSGSVPGCKVLAIVE